MRQLFITVNIFRLFVGWSFMLDPIESIGALAILTTFFHAMWIVSDLNNEFSLVAICAIGGRQMRLSYFYLRPKVEAHLKQ